MTEPVMEGAERMVTCIACPRGCRVTVRFDAQGKVETFDGARCKRGRLWLEKELAHPLRMLTTTVRTVFSDFPRLPVRTSRDIPLGELLVVMKRIETLEVSRRMWPGDVVEPEIFRDEKGAVALIATGAMEQPEKE
jgi:CxxC motif-containing protein